MKRQLGFVLVATLLIGLQAVAADKPGKMDAQKQEMMKKFEAAATPGAPHKMLADMAGEWKINSQMWEAPNAKPETSNGTASFKMVLGGRWLQQDMKGTAMGQPYEGLSFIGYDNVKGKYVSNWMDSMSTGLAQAEGDYDASSKTIKDKGEMSCPLSSDKEQDFRSEWKMVSKNKMIFSMFGKGPEEKFPEFKMMEIVYTR